ncbi:MAG: hypothetical protein GDA56_19420 [Hormoscilla sp. GM7CHS1pb]|nr:hypothetical protein [Hormoscilla sp. GM7CHS1pb]
MQNQLIETYPDIMSGTGICGHPRTSKYSVQLPREKVSYEFLDDFPTVSRDRAIAVLNSAMGSSCPRAPTLSLACPAATWVGVSGHDRLTRNPVSDILD